MLAAARCHQKHRRVVVQRHMFALLLLPLPRLALWHTIWRLIYLQKLHLFMAVGRGVALVVLVWYCALRPIHTVPPHLESMPRAIHLDDQLHLTRLVLIKFPRLLSKKL